MRLIEPAEEYKSAYRSFAEEIAADGDASYLERLNRRGFEWFLLTGKPLAPGLVSETVFWLADDARTIHGELRLRHDLNEKLEKEGGHIGYTVRPSSRRRGLGKGMLRQGLQEARKLGISEVLITCDDDNVGSAKVIEANGGTDYETGISEYSGKLIRRYRLRT